jgi:hypothetical protein
MKSLLMPRLTVLSQLCLSSCAVSVHSLCLFLFSLFAHMIPGYDTTGMTNTAFMGVFVSFSFMFAQGRTESAEATPCTRCWSFREMELICIFGSTGEARSDPCFLSEQTLHDLSLWLGRRSRNTNKLNQQILFAKLSVPRPSDRVKPLLDQTALTHLV